MQGCNTITYCRSDKQLVRAGSIPGFVDPHGHGNRSCMRLFHKKSTQGIQRSGRPRDIFAHRNWLMVYDVARPLQGMI